MTHPTTLTLNEAGYVLDQPSQTLNRAVDRGVIEAKVRIIGKIKQRTFGRAELRFLKVSHGLSKELTPAGRKRIYQAIRRLPDNERRLELGLIILELGSVDDQISSRMQRLVELKDAVRIRPGEEPALRDSGAPAYVVAALAKGQTIAEILEDYPALTEDGVRIAVDFAKAYPKPGRPYPTRSFKRMIGDLAAGGAFDVEAEPIAPKNLR